MMDTWILIILIAAFIAIVFWVFRRGGRKQFEEHGKIPLKKDSKEGKDGDG
jgi:cbb3-type cytochrome oxidase subunit 3